MEKPYDLKDLGEKMKADGLELAEDGAGKVYKCLKAWLKESAEMSSNPFDDVAMKFLEQADGVVLGAIDQIDGHQG